MRTLKEKQEARKAEAIGLWIIIVSNLIVWTLVAIKLDGILK